MLTKDQFKSNEMRTGLGWGDRGWEGMGGRKGRIQYLPLMYLSASSFWTQRHVSTCMAPITGFLGQNISLILTYHSYLVVEI